MEYDDNINSNVPKSIAIMKLVKDVVIIGSGCVKGRGLILNIVLSIVDYMTDGFGIDKKIEEYKNNNNETK